jgi:hypothetical protein
MPGARPVGKRWRRIGYKKNRAAGPLAEIRAGAAILPPTMPLRRGDQKAPKMLARKFKGLIGILR